MHIYKFFEQNNYTYIYILPAIVKQRLVLMSYFTRFLKGSLAGKQA